MGPEGIDRWLEYFGAKDDFDLREKLGLDIRTAGPVYIGPNTERGLTPWGTEPNVMGWEGFGYSQSRGCYPLANATSLADIDAFSWPDPDEFEYDIAGKVLETVPDKARLIRIGYSVEENISGQDEAVQGKSAEWIPFVCTLFNLFGLEETLTKLRTDTKMIEAAINHMEDFLLGVSHRLLKATKGLADLFWCGDDFSTQRGMMISPEDWRRFLKPTYAKMFEIAKGYGLKVWFHSCGTFRPVLPDLIDIGMDVWEPVQAHLEGNEPEVLKREYGRDIAFYGAINTQSTLPFGTPEEVRAEVRERIRVLGKGGGYVCGPDHAILPDVPIDNVLAMLDEARKYAP